VVDHPAARQQRQAVELLVDGVARLVDGHDDSASPIGQPASRRQNPRKDLGDILYRRA